MTASGTLRVPAGLGLSQPVRKRSVQGEVGGRLNPTPLGRSAEHCQMTRVGRKGNGRFGVSNRDKQTFGLGNR